MFNLYLLLTKFPFGIPDKRLPKAAAPASAARRHHGCAASLLIFNLRNLLLPRTEGHYSVITNQISPSARG